MARATVHLYGIVAKGGRFPIVHSAGMWDDRAPDSRLRSWEQKLRQLLPEPAPGPARLRRTAGFVWLDGGPGGGHRRFAAPAARLSCRGGRAVVSTSRGKLRFRAGGFDLLAAALAAWRQRGGWLAGYLGYELGGELEALPPPPPDDLGLPDLWLGLYDSVCREAPGDAASPPPPAAVPVAGRPGRPGFRAAVARSVERIRAGEIYQVNLCRRLEAPLPSAAAWPLYQRLRQASPAERGAFLQLGGGRAVLSVSPERFLTVRGGRVESHPIKGTRRRGATPEEDRALARELAASEKDRAELAMIVDVTRNDLGRVCVPGSVEVARHAELLTLPTVFHTVSTVTGTLRPGCGPAELLRASFPPASITGAPKIQAMKVAAGEEERRRGPAMGAFGWIDVANGDLDLAVAIRTAVAARGRVAYHAGCGIVADSDPEEELAESDAKARAFLAALGGREEP